MIGRVFGYVLRRSLPYAIAFTLGAVAGSGVLSKKDNQDYVHQQVNVSDEKGRHYVVDLEKGTLKEMTDNHPKREDSKLVELLK